MRLVAGALLGMVLCASQTAAQSVGPGGTIPAVANGPGRNGTLWRSDVNVLNVSPSDTSVVMLLTPEIIDGEPAFEPRVSDPITVAAGAQVTIANVVQSRFGLANTKGGLNVFSLNGAPLVVTSRTYTVASEGGSYGQEVFGVLVAKTAWVSGVRQDSLYRTNIGVFLPVEPVPPATFTVTVFREDGTEVGSGSIFFDQAGLQQKALSAFGVSTLVSGYVVIECSDPSLTWFGYGSRADQVTGDAVYRPALGREADLP